MMTKKLKVNLNKELDRMRSELETFSYCPSLHVFGSNGTFVKGSECPLCGGILKSCRATSPSIAHKHLHKMRKEGKI